MSNELGTGFLRALLQHRTPSGDSLCFDTTALSGLQLDSIRASPGRLTATMPVTDAVANRYGTLHGGCIGALGGGAAALSSHDALRPPSNHPCLLAFCCRPHLLTSTQQCPCLQPHW